MMGLEPLPLAPRGDTARRRPSVPWSWSSSVQDCEKPGGVCKPPSLWWFRPSSLDASWYGWERGLEDLETGSAVS